jgi:aquaporin Z
MRKYIAEFIGTFFLVFTIGCTVLFDAPGVIAPLAIGAILMTMIFAGGHISGGHFNPAVTLGVWLRGRCATADVLPYMLAQVLGGLAAAFAVLVLKGVPGTPGPLAAGPALLAEFLFTFALVYVVINVATAKGTSENSFYGLAIISGAAFNPAVAISAALMGLLSWSSLWIYFVANFAGGAVAALVFRFLNPDDK